jgi:transmembrane sensor
LPLAAAACAVALVAVLAQLVWSSGRVPRSYASGVGETRTVSLPDGSTTALNTATRLSWLGGAQRRVRLSGEALFEVKPDHQRPFQIELKASRITVLGTRFNVYEKANDDVVVTVLEGRVNVQGQAPGGQWRQDLTGGEEMQYSPSGRRVVRVVDPAEATGWQEGKFRSPSASLDRVVGELRRYTRSQIIIADPSLNALNVGGVFDLHNVPLALKRVVESADVPIILTHSGDQFVLSRGRATASAPRPAASAQHGPLHGPIGKAQ